VYGQKRQQSDDSAFKGHQAQIKPLVDQLGELEDASQINFWRMKMKKWGG
jgi:hypothetical protein